MQVIFEERTPAGLNGSIQESHSSQLTLASPATKANSHTLTAASRHAEDPISKGVPPPLPLPVDVEVLELEVELFVCDVLLEASLDDSGATVVPTNATLVVVGSGLTVIGTTVVVEDVAATLGFGEMVELELMLVLVLVIVLVLVLVADALASGPADWIVGAPFWPPPCPYPLPPSLGDELPAAFEQSAWAP